MNFAENCSKLGKAGHASCNKGCPGVFGKNVGKCDYQTGKCSCVKDSRALFD